MRLIAPLATLLWFLGAAVPASAALPQGTHYDDGFVWMQLENHQNTKNGKPFSEGWTLQSWARIIGKDVPNRSALKYVIRAGKQKLAEIRCELSFHRDGYTENTVPQWEVTNCRDRNAKIKKDGAIIVDVIFVNGDDDSESLIRSHSILVDKVSRVRGNGERDAEHYYINKAGETQVAMMNLLPGRQYPYLEGGRNSTHENATVELYFNAAPVEWNGKPDDKGDDIDALGAFFRCSVDGKKLKIDDDKASIKELRHNHVIMTWNQGRRSEQNQVSYRQYRVRTPFTHGDAGNRLQGAPALEDNPGKWECEIKNNGKLLRTFTWTVGADGKIVGHPEEAHVQLGPWAHLVRTTVPEGTGFETRVDPATATKMGFFYGHKPVTAEAKAWAKALPKVGDSKAKKLR